MAKKSKKAKAVKGGVVEVDFTDVKGGRTRVPEGDYRVKIAEAKMETAESGNHMIVWTFEIVEGKHKGKQIQDRSVLVQKALWRLRNLLEACGKSVPERSVKVNYRKLVGTELGVTLTDDEYEGRIYSSVADYLDLETLTSGGVDDEEEFESDDEDEEEDEDEEDEDVDDDDDEDDEDEDDEDLEEVDEDEL